MLFRSDAYAEEAERTVLRFHPEVAPVKVAVFPLVNKEGMPEMAEKIFFELKKRWNCFFDDKGAVGRRYRRQDEIGTPYCITVDGESLKDNAVTVRERDSMAQTRVSVDKLVEHLSQTLSTGV